MLKKIEERGKKNFPESQPKDSTPKLNTSTLIPPLPSTVPESLTVPNQTVKSVNTDELVNISPNEKIVDDEAESGCITGIVDLDQIDGARCSLTTTQNAGEHRQWPQ